MAAKAKAKPRATKTSRAVKTPKTASKAKAPKTAAVASARPKATAAPRASSINTPASAAPAPRVNVEPDFDLIVDDLDTAAQNDLPLWMNTRAKRLQFRGMVSEYDVMVRAGDTRRHIGPRLLIDGNFGPTRSRRRTFEMPELSFEYLFDDARPGGRNHHLATQKTGSGLATPRQSIPMAAAVYVPSHAAFFANRAPSGHRWRCVLV